MFEESDVFTLGVEVGCNCCGSRLEEGEVTATSNIWDILDNSVIILLVVVLLDGGEEEDIGSKFVVVFVIFFVIDDGGAIVVWVVDTGIVLVVDLDTDIFEVGGDVVVVVVVPFGNEEDKDGIDCGVAVTAVESCLLSTCFIEVTADCVEA